MKHIVSLSGGKDSTAMLLMMLEKNMPVDEIIYCDTGAEFPEMYKHLNQVEKFTGIEITRLKNPTGDFFYYFSEHEKTVGKHKGKKGYAWPSFRARWCTRVLKTGVIEKYLKQTYKEIEIKEYIGIAFDEKERVHDKEYPLVDWKITEKEALKYCYERGFTWGGYTKYLTECPVIYVRCNRLES